MAETVKVEGLQDIIARLDALPGELTAKGAGGPLLVALRRLGSRIQKDAQSRVPVKTGTLRENIITTRLPKKRRKEGQEAVEVTVRYKVKKKYVDNARNRKLGRVGGEYRTRGPLEYARFLEFGTSKMRARPFLTTAFEANKAQMPELFAKEMAKSIDEAVKKLARRKK